jgi:hypothetical protein
MAEAFADVDVEHAGTLDLGEFELWMLAGAPDSGRELSNLVKGASAAAEDEEEESELTKQKHAAAIQLQQSAMSVVQAQQEEGQERPANSPPVDNNNVVVSGGGGGGVPSEDQQQYTSHLKDNRAKMLCAFEALDRDGSGTLGKDELHYAVTLMGSQHVEDVVFETMWQRLDHDGSGRASYREFGSGTYVQKAKSNRVGKHSV